MLVNSQLKFLISRRGKNRTSFEKIQLLSDISSFLSLIRFQFIIETRSLAYSLEPIESCADGVDFTSIYLGQQPFTRRLQRIFTRGQLPEKGLRRNLFPQRKAGRSHSWVSIHKPRGGFCLQPDFIRRPNGWKSLQWFFIHKPRGGFCLQSDFIRRPNSWNSLQRVSIRKLRGGFCLQPDFIRRLRSAGCPSPTLHGRPISVGSSYIYNV